MTELYILYCINIWILALTQLITVIKWIHKGKLLFLFLILTMLTAGFSVHSAQLSISHDTISTDVLSQGTIFHAKTTQFPQSLEQLNSWRALQVKPQSNPMPTGRYWFYLPLKNDSSLSEFVLDPQEQSMSNLTLGIYQDAHFSLIKQSYQEQHDFLFDSGQSIQFDKGKSYHLLVLFDHNNQSVPARLNIESEVDYGQKTALQSISILICIGFLFAVSTYSFFVWAVSRNIDHFYYAVSALILNWGWFNAFNLSETVSGFSVEALQWLPMMLLPLTFGLFGSRFFNLRKYSVLLHKLILANGFISVLLVGFVFYSPGYGAIPAILANTTWLVLGLIGGIKSFARGFRSAYYFTAGYGCVLTSGLLAWSMHWNILKGFTDNQVMVVLFGFTLNAILMSFALVDKFTAIARRNIASGENLENTVGQRTEELLLANQHLEKMAEASEAASAAKNTFLVNMSHEIRTPLTAIIGYADGILQGDIQDKARDEAISVISKNGVHLLHVISDLLDISKIESQTLEVEMVTFDPLQLLQGISQLVVGQVNEKQLTLNIHYILPLPTQMISDPTRVRQVLLNLINNAIKFTHQGSVEIDISADTNKLYFAISDTGIGMNQGMLDGMFKAFNQEDLSKSRKYGGTGLGLSIAKSLTNKLGGEIKVTSVQGQGSTFTVSFGLQVPETANWLHEQGELDQSLAKISQTATDVENIDLPSLSGNVLLAEDHLDNQLLFTRMLERMGLDVTAVDNGYKAVQATLDVEFDLILLDIQMPEMDGFKAFELIQSTCSNAPVIALTANAMKEDVELYMKLGFNDHIPKPVNRQIFIDTIASYLNVDKPSDFGLDDFEMDDIKIQYITRLVKRVDDIKAAQAINDWEDIGKHAHAIKGSAGMFGFDDLGVLGAKLELSVTNNDLADCKRHLDDLLGACEAITANAQ
jgi:signal transduction histidine kinase/CheY-like chemotaxis protein/HPt (histidine-containing phosphotransfer) domain-containing protein